MARTHPVAWASDLFTSAFPILSTANLERALGFYRDLLDGKVSYRFPPEGDPAFVTVRIGSSSLGIGHDLAAKEGPGGQRTAMWVYADDCDALILLAGYGRLRWASWSGCAAGTSTWPAPGSRWSSRRPRSPAGSS